MMDDDIPDDTLLECIYGAYVQFTYAVDAEFARANDDDLRAALAEIENKPEHERAIHVRVAHHRITYELLMRAMAARARASGAEVYCVAHDCDIKVCASKHPD